MTTEVRADRTPPGDISMAPRPHGERSLPIKLNEFNGAVLTEQSPHRLGHGRLSHTAFARDPKTLRHGFTCGGSPCAGTGPVRRPGRTGSGAFNWEEPDAGTAGDRLAAPPFSGPLERADERVSSTILTGR